MLFVSPRRISVGWRLKIKELATRPAESNGRPHRRAPRGMQLLETKGLIQRKYCKARKIQRKSYGSDTASPLPALSRTATSTLCVPDRKDFGGPLPKPCGRPGMPLPRTTDRTFGRGQ